MKEQRIFQALLVLGSLLAACNIYLYFSSKAPSIEPGMIAQNTYLGPTRPIPGNPQLVKVEILIKDSADLAGVQIQRVTFDGQEIPLKPRDIFGKRGGASFQVAPGQYTLRWTVNRDKIVWPRQVSHEELVNISGRDLWVQIIIEGNNASIR